MTSIYCQELLIFSVLSLGRGRYVLINRILDHGQLNTILSIHRQDGKSQLHLIYQHMSIRADGCIAMITIGTYAPGTR